MLKDYLEITDTTCAYYILFRRSSVGASLIFKIKKTKNNNNGQKSQLVKWAVFELKNERNK